MNEFIAENWIAASILVIFGFTLVRFFQTKTPGYGPYNTSTLILILTVMITALGLFTGKLSETSSANLLFVVAGYAGGLMVAGKSKA